jgi:hypothetical protein
MQHLIHTCGAFIRRTVIEFSITYSLIHAWTCTNHNIFPLQIHSLSQFAWGTHSCRENRTSAAAGCSSTGC